MLTQDEYEKLKEKYGAYSSWAIWSHKDPSDTTEIEKNLDQLNSRFVLLGLNMSRLLNKPAWFNFHDNTHARKLKYACNDTLLRGTYMTDLFKDIYDPSSINVNNHILKEDIDKNVKLFNQEISDIKIDDKTQFILFGNLAFDFYNRYFRQTYKNNAIYFKHYSSRGTDKGWVEGFWNKLNIQDNFENILARYKN